VGQSSGGELRGRISVLGWVHIFALVCAAAATLWSFDGRMGAVRGPATASNELESSHGKSQLGNTVLSASVARPMYPYSVIPGGVESGAELKNAVFRDPVVAGHYADFDLSKARIVRLDRDRAVYVSYRLGDRVYWTKKTLRLFKGETLISDGVHEARTRCGNRLSDLPVGPVSPQEPPPAAMAAPLPPTLFAVNQPPPGFPVTGPVPPAPGSAPPSGPPGGGIIPPPIFPIGGGPKPPHHSITPPPPPPPPPPKVPEPDTSALLAAGFLILLAGGLLPWFRKKRKA
jgi:hypothetical protein